MSASVRCKLHPFHNLWSSLIPPMGVLNKAT